MPKATNLTFDQAFAADLSSGVDYADALTAHVTGNNKVRRAAALQTLQAIAGLSMEDLQGLLFWAQEQDY